VRERVSLGGADRRRRYWAFVLALAIVLPGRPRGVVGFTGGGPAQFGRGSARLVTIGPNSEQCLNDRAGRYALLMTARTQSGAPNALLAVLSK